MMALQYNQKLKQIKLKQFLNFQANLNSHLQQLKVLFLVRIILSKIFRFLKLKDFENIFTMKLDLNKTDFKEVNK